MVLMVFHGYCCEVIDCRNMRSQLTSLTLRSVSVAQDFRKFKTIQSSYVCFIGRKKRRSRFYLPQSDVKCCLLYLI